jgi:DNA-binding response OmpR family regulator
MLPEIDAGVQEPRRSQQTPVIFLTARTKPTQG